MGGEHHLGLPTRGHGRLQRHEVLPRSDLTRGALAKALADGLGLPATSTDFYTDDEASRFEGGINRLPRRAWPEAAATALLPDPDRAARGLAAALATALQLPSAGHDYFSDDEDSPHEGSINRIAAAGISTGCGNGRFCPERSGQPRARRRLPAQRLRLTGTTRRSANRPGRCWTIWAIATPLEDSVGLAASRYVSSGVPDPCILDSSARSCAASLPRRLAAAVALPLATQPVRATDGQTFLDLVNDRRAGAGLSPVDANDVIDRIAVSRANQMAADRALGHDLGYVEERLAANGLCWEQLGEIVAYNAPASERVRFVEQWYTSDGHRAIMLAGATPTRVGAGRRQNGYSYGAMVFVKLCNAPPCGGPSTESRRRVAWLP